MALEARLTSRGRILRGSEETVQVTVYQNGSAIDATGAVTYTAKKADGTTLVTGSATKPVGTTGVYEFELPAQTTLNRLVITWAGDWSGSQTFRTVVEIVGGHLFSEAEAREYDNGALSDPNRFTDAAIAKGRDIVTDLIEKHTGVSWVTRFKRRKLRGSGGNAIRVPERFLKTMLSASIGGEALTSEQLAEVVPDDESGIFYRPTGSIWTPSASDPLNVVLEYEYGKDYPEEGVDDIALMWAVYVLRKTKVSDRAVSHTDELGQTTRFAGFFPSGLPYIDGWVRARSLVGA